MADLGLKPKQAEFFRAFRSGKFRYLCLAGTTGSGKTICSLGLLHLLCCKIPGLRFGVFRKSDKVLKQTTIPSYNKIKELTKSTGDSFIVNMTARYPKTGSEIVFTWADITKDPDLNNVKGLELTAALFEEANQMDPAYFHLTKTRIGRWNNHLCPAFILLTLNPSLGWIKELFYDNAVNGTLPEGHHFLEFDEQDARHAAGDTYVKNLRDLPDEEYNRFVLNRWDYSDVPNQLIKYEWYKQCIRDDYQFDPILRTLEAIDPAWEGNDDTVFGIMNGTHMGWWDAYGKQDPDFSGILGYNKALEFGVRKEDVSVDPIGLGAATFLKMQNDLKFRPTKFMAGDTPVNQFGILQAFNRRSEGGWILREALRNEEVTMTHHPQLQKDLLAIRYSVDEKKIRIRPKIEIKKEYGFSPGFYDVAVMLAHRWKTTTSRLSEKLFDQQLAPARDLTRSSSRAVRERAILIMNKQQGVE